MRFLHLSDLHLGKRVNEFSMLEDQAYILKEILNIIDEQKVEAVLIAGDIYDKVIPSAEAVRLLDDFLTRIAARELPVFLISGNHDSAERIAFGSRLMSSRQIYLSPVFESDVEPVTISDRYGEINIYMLPFVKPSLVKRVYPEEEIITYQDAVNVAKEFDEKVGVDGVILSKMDGDTRGGAALSIKAVTGKPILFVSMGEKLSDLEQFYPDRMASRILGMGDVLSLIDKAQASIDIDEEKSRDMAGRMKKGKFDFEDYLESMKQMRNMGGLSSILGMLPGMGIKASDLEGAIDETQMKRTEAIVLSMTKEERRNPKILTPQRKHRIAKGAGVDIATVNRFIKQFEQTQKMMKQFGGGKKGRGGMGGMFGGGKFPGIGGRFF